MTSDERLTRYRHKRDFTSTAEPPGASGDGPARLFVVQRHRARRRHYDLRFELDGVLVSWAVPKGPTLDPDLRRLAMHVEDHPVEYADFEGVIPRGQYGGGDVIVWDQGRWEPAGTDDPAAALADGNLHFDLYGSKLSGRFVLIRRGRRGDDKGQWLLLHKHDEHAVPGWDVEAHPESVLSGRTNEQVAAAPEVFWRSDLPASDAATPVGGPDDKALAGLDRLGSGGRWRVSGHELNLSNLDKELFPAAGDEEPVTKRELVAYYARIAPTLLPYLADRPLHIHRFPDGVTDAGFWQKAAPSPAPDWVRRWHDENAKANRTQYYLVADQLATLPWLANYGVVELHAWTSRIPDVHYPTWVLFDIDPGPNTSFADIVEFARLHRDALDHLGIEGRPKVTGQRGVQVWVPIEPRYTFAETREWAYKVSKAIGMVVPERVSWKWGKDERGGLARLDYTQNAIAKTLVTPYSVRPRPGAPVSVPLEWAELDDPDLRPDRWTIRTVPARLEHGGDPLAALLGMRQRLPPL